MVPVQKSALASLVTLAAGALALAPSCGEPVLKRDCFLRVWVPREEADARIVGSWDGWNPVGAKPEPFDANWSLARLRVVPGEHHYLVDLGDRLAIDPFNPLTAFRAGDEREVSLAIVPDCEVPAIDVERAAFEGGELVVEGRFLAAESGARLAPESLSVALATGEAFAVTTTDEATGAFEARAPSPGPGKYAIAMAARDGDGVEAEAPRLALWDGAKADNADDALLYQIVIDRYRGDLGEPLAAPATKGSRAGGTLGGVLASIEDGTFEALGVTGLWLSPLYTNPPEPRPGNFDGRMYEGYHGYWPAQSREVDPRIGGEAALEAVVTAAHGRGLTVLADLVPNHVDITNPLYGERAGERFFNPDDCVCGAPDCPWSSAIQTCWFTPYLPDVRYRHPDALGLAADDAVWWLERFDLDGFRVDAVPMMPRAATRRIARAVRDRAWEGRGTFLLGEIFTGPGAGAYDQLRTYLGRDTLDSLFDFPRMWALRDAIAREGEWESVDAILDVGEAAFRGSGATIATMLDNHDVPRFMAAMTGDAGRDAWENSPPQPDDDASYERMRLGLTALFTLPGMPVLYYGDEVGLTGAGDPDNRRVMPAESELLDAQRATREHTARLSRLRRCSEALRRGDRATLTIAGPAWAYARGLDTPSPVLVALNAGATEAALATSAWPPGAWIDAATGDSVAIEADGSLAMMPRSSRVLVRADSPCRLQ